MANIRSYIERHKGGGGIIISNTATITIITHTMYGEINYLGLLEEYISGQYKVLHIEGKKREGGRVVRRLGEIN